MKLVGNFLRHAAVQLVVICALSVNAAPESDFVTLGSWSELAEQYVAERASAYSLIVPDSYDLASGHQVPGLAAGEEILAKDWFWSFNRGRIEAAANSPLAKSESASWR